MSQKKQRLPFGERLIKSMEEGLTALKENRPLPYTVIPLPPAPLPFEKERMIRLRQRLNWSQTALAIWLNVSNKTVQSWEQGTRKPSGSTLRLLQILEQPGMLEQILPSGPELPGTRPSRQTRHNE